MENKGWNARNGMGMRARRISMEMRIIWVEMQKLLRIRMAVHNGNLIIAVERTQNSTGNEWRKVKIIESEHICKNSVSHTWSGAFLVNFDQLSHNVFLFYYWFWTEYWLGRLSKMGDLCHFNINSLRPSF